MIGNVRHLQIAEAVRRLKADRARQMQTRLHTEREEEPAD
jgi:hypothetical protein